MINKPKILIICEGYEETEYLEYIKKLNVWDNYDIDLINAESNGSLFSLYQYHYQNDNYDLVLMMADTDRPTYDSFLLVLKKKIVDTKMQLLKDLKKKKYKLIT